LPPIERPAAEHELPEVLDLIRAQFAYMDGLIDPASSMHDLTLDALKGQQIWVVGDPIFACMILTERPMSLYVGKVAIDPVMRGQGVLAKLIERAKHVALDANLSELELESRIELVEVHRAFARVGFQEVGRGIHLGFDDHTFITMKTVVL